MFAALIAHALELRPLNAKASYSVAKELALIEINMLWYPDAIGANIDRLGSLANHISITFKPVPPVTTLVAEIRDTVRKLYTKLA